MSLRARLLLALVALVATIGVPATAGAVQGGPSSIDASLAARIDGARPLDDVRVGLSEDEPEYCSAELVREVNPAAANRSSIEVGPPKFLVEELPPGSTWRHCVSIYNRSPDPRSVELTALDVTGSLDPDVRIETQPSTTGVGSWITFGVERLDLEPGERVLVPYLFEVPADPPGGTVTAGISVEDVSQDGADVAGARVRRTLVTQLQVTFPGGVARPLEVDVTRATRFVWTGRDPDRATVEYTLSNVGEVVDTAEVEYSVEGLFGREFASISTTREVLIGRSAQEFRIDWRNLPWIGVYRPTLVVTANDGTRRIDLPRVWILPPWPAIAAFVGSLVLLAWGLLRRRRAWQAYLDDEDTEIDDDEWSTPDR